MGGSGIGGTIVAELLQDECMVPVAVVNDYALPAFVNASTLVIASSYSGNTEETYAALQDAIAKNAQVACITSGGIIGELARQRALTALPFPEETLPVHNSVFSHFAVAHLHRLRIDRC